MMGRPVRTSIVALWLCLATGGIAIAGGFTLGMSFGTLDLTAALGQLPIAVGAALDELEAAAAALGLPPAELEDIQAQFDQAQSDLLTFTAVFPTWVPVPLLGVSLEFGLPLIVVDSLQLSGGWLSDDALRSIAGLAGVQVPQPLADVELDFGGEAGHVAADVELTAWSLSTDLVKRLDLFLLAIRLGAGIELFQGRIVPQIAFDLPADFMAGAAAARDALHLDGLTWSGAAVHGLIGLELGPPFFRLCGDLRFVIPVSQKEDWWGLRLGRFSALLGFVIRF